ASARRMMTLLVGQLNDSRNAPNYKHILASMKEIGTTYIHILREHKELIISFKESAPEVVKESIDLMEGRSLKTVTEQVVYVKGDVDELDDRVTVTQEHISELNITAESTANATVDAIGDIAAHEKRFNELEDKVDDTIQKVEEVDQKTVSNAPSWSVDVSTLLNVEDGRDWRFLAIRLGYLSEDIRQLATAQNPTMSLLSEWYSTHKYREATFAVMTSLKELGRSECVNIIEDALNASGETVLEKPSDLTHPPVFISYQWDHQSEVKTLKEHLEMAGYECWMDIGQMGGGDKLYEKIDEGLRGAKIVLSMCSEKYSHSKNCNHEMSLANLLNKPIVPILLEDIDWPPAGPMG
uniref:Uncharacterized protein LOC102810009 n=1 Tax=Saccoglossus kowalevskii TaxID=10224 RepID=A0ABM0M4J8_SACKO